MSRERADDWFDTVYGYDEKYGEISRLVLTQILDEHEKDIRMQEREACAQIADTYQQEAIAVSERCVVEYAKHSWGDRSIGAAQVARDIRERGAK